MIKIYIKILKAILKNFFTKEKIIYISDASDWIINVIGINLKSNLNKIGFEIGISPIGLKNKIIHFGSVGSLIKSTGIKSINSSNKIILTWFHIVENDPLVKYIPELNNKVDIVHTAALNTKKKLVYYGLDKSKIKIIPLGVNPESFYPFTIEKKKNLRKKLQIPSNRIVIGSFQKDGVGWGEGLEPKLIKGPDVFCDAVIEISKNFDILILLSGPARGYVKKRLSEAGIPYIHKYLNKYEKVAEFYNVIDLYIVSSREEGLPMAILESMACGVPIISTKVGLAPEMIEHNKNGFLCEIGDYVDIAGKSNIVITNPELKNSFIDNGLDTISNYNWQQISNKFLDNLYKPLINND